jgi:bacillithiol biosynthesis deacetylase BshB1
MKLDILAFGAHPDDIELSCGGTIISHVDMGYKVGAIDLTLGEMGTRGTVATRKEEAENAAKIMGLSVRENLEMEDGWFEVNQENQLAVIRKIRKYQPEIVLANATFDRHPDHGRGAKLVEEAIFKAGLVKIETIEDGVSQLPWRPKKLLHYIQSVSLTPDIYIDISSALERKMEAVKAYRTQFYIEGDDGPQTYISSQNFMDMLTSRVREYGQRINVDYAEGFCLPQPSGVKDLFQLL